MNNNISYPYPVLGINDDIQPELDDNSIDIIAIEDNDPNFFNYSVELNYNNDDIINLVKNNAAVIVCSVECKNTIYLKSFRSDSPKFIINIPQTDVCGRITFRTTIAANIELHDYRNKGFNEDYGVDASFHLYPGDLLATFPTLQDNTMVRYHKEFSAGAFMVIRKGNENYKDVAFDLTGNKIEIVMPPALYDKYNRPEVTTEKAIIHSSLVTNALTYALMNIENYPKTDWAESINIYMNSKPDLKDLSAKNKRDSIIIAQRLLGNPYNRLFDSLIQLHTTDSE